MSLWVLILNFLLTMNLGGYNINHIDCNLIHVFEEMKKEYQTKEEVVNNDEVKSIIISVAGDTTLGYDEDFGYYNSFDHEFERQGKNYNYFFSNVKEIFKDSDISILNLEGTLTNHDQPKNKKFTFKGKPEYAKILKKGHIDAVNLANNHTMDFGNRGFQDTKKSLEQKGIGYFGYDLEFTKEVKGKKFSILGFTGWYVNQERKNYLSSRIEQAKANSDAVIVTFHWGNEYEYVPNDTQKELGRSAIESGADMVWGHHPHVLQGIEQYEERYIAYSLGNFCFGGNKNPSDKDSMIFQNEFKFKNGKIEEVDHNIIPISISSKKERNNYQPTPVQNKEKERINERIKELNKKID